jgi:protein-disulfide isomerase
VATKPKKSSGYDLKAADRRRSMLIRIALTATVIIIAAALFTYIVVFGKNPQSGEAKAIRVANSNVIKKDGSSDPKAVISVYEDFLCPVCGRFEKEFGPTITQLISSGAVAVDYYMVAILDSPATQNYSSRAGASGYCVADADTTPNKEVFTRFHAALYAQQPSETGTSFPDDKALIETARQAGVVGDVPNCVNSNRYINMVKELAGNTNVHATPTIRINGEDFQYSTPDALVAKIKEITG